MEEKQQKINKAINFDFSAYGWGEPKADGIPRMMRDEDLEQDFRNLLIQFDWSDFDLNDFLQDCESTRYLDLRWAYEILKALKADRAGGGIDTLSELAMQYSLCPVHFVDWAICFDDEPEDCSQVRAIFPRSHDT